MKLGRTVGRVALVALGVLFLPAPAGADVVMAPERSCPAGSVGSTCHGGPHCSPSTCATDADCRDGKTCRTLPLCVGSLDCGGRGGSRPTETVEGSCGGGKACARGECRSVQVCAPEPGLLGDGCRLAPGGRTSVSTGWLLLVAVGLLLRRRGRA